MTHRLYDNAQTVVDENAILSDFIHRSQQALNKYPSSTTTYGNNNRQDYTFFPCDQAQGTVVFIHGGYWQWCRKEDFAFLAHDCLAQNWQCILLEYPLTPHVTLTNIVDSVALALNHLNQRTDLGDYIIGIGHSAGAHLLAMHQNHALFDELHLLSGIYDLSPLQNTHLNDALQLSHHDMAKFSPITTIPTHQKPICIAYGQDELPELIAQSENYGNKLSPFLPCSTTLSLPQTNHYTILDHYFSQLFAE